MGQAFFRFTSKRARNDQPPGLRHSPYFIKDGQLAVFDVYHQTTTLISPITSSQDHAVPRLPIHTLIFISSFSIVKYQGKRI